MKTRSLHQYTVFVWCLLYTSGGNNKLFPGCKSNVVGVGAGWTPFVCGWPSDGSLRYAGCLTYCMKFTMLGLVIIKTKSSIQCCDRRHHMNCWSDMHCICRQYTNSWLCVRRRDKGHYIAAEWSLGNSLVSCKHIKWCVMMLFVDVCIMGCVSYSRCCRATHSVACTYKDSVEMYRQTELKYQTPTIWNNAMFAL